MDLPKLIFPRVTFQPDANSKHGSHRWSIHKVLSFKFLLSLSSMIFGSRPRFVGKDVSHRKWVTLWLSNVLKPQIPWTYFERALHVALPCEQQAVASSFVLANIQQDEYPDGAYSRLPLQMLLTHFTFLLSRLFACM